MSNLREKYLENSKFKFKNKNLFSLLIFKKNE